MPHLPVNRKRFSLVPFPGEGDAEDLSIGGTIARSGRRLVLDCTLRGNLPRLAIPPRVEAGRRRRRLWEETCLELFLAETGSERYREFHLSPSGDWNVYRFGGYRAGMREDRAFSTLPFRIGWKPAEIRFSLHLEIGGIVRAQAPLEGAVCAILRTASDATLHWALAHPGFRPDFHRREGFSLILPAE